MFLFNSVVLFQLLQLFSGEVHGPPQDQTRHSRLQPGKIEYGIVAPALIYLNHFLFHIFPIY